MRLWHKDLIPVLPRQQLLGQWRECCLIAKSIAEKGTPNHLLVNKVMEYPIEHLYNYSMLMIRAEMEKRGFECNYEKFFHWYTKCIESTGYPGIKLADTYKEWHNDRYLTQCYYNLQEKYDCGGISEDEWQKIEDFYRKRSALVECNVFDKETTYTDCTVQILENSVTGETSVGWWRNE